jgi:hypothetical protein
MELKLARTGLLVVSTDRFRPPIIKLLRDSGLFSWGDRKEVKEGREGVFRIEGVGREVDTGIGRAGIWVGMTVEMGTKASPF